MGPDASARCYQLLIQLAQEEYLVTQNNEYPEIVLHSIPVPDFVSDMSSAEEALKMLKDRVKSLTLLQPQVFGIACNTVHIYFDELKKETPVPFVSIIDQVSKLIHEKKYRSVGILASPSTIHFGLYQSELEKIHVRAVLPTEQEQKDLGDIIHSVISGKRSRSNSFRLHRVTSYFSRNIFSTRH